MHFWITKISEFIKLLELWKPFFRLIWGHYSQGHSSGLKYCLQKMSVECKYIIWESKTRKTFASRRILPRLTPNRACWVARGKVLKEYLPRQLTSKEAEICEIGASCLKWHLMAVFTFSLNTPLLPIIKISEAERASSSESIRNPSSTVNGSILVPSGWMFFRFHRKILYVEFLSLGWIQVLFVSFIWQ